MNAPALPRDPSNDPGGANWWRRAALPPVPSHPLFDRLWTRYVEEVPWAATFARLAQASASAAAPGARFHNDHIALRSLARDGVGSGIGPVAAVFERLGWRRAGAYEFPDVHLRSVHLSRPGLPRVFISELDPLALPADARDALLGAPALRPPPDDDDDLAGWFTGPPPPSPADLDVVQRASQVGAWLLCFGRKVNHFTAQVTDIDAWQHRLVAAGVPMKAEIEGARGGPLRQTATQAALLDVVLADGARRSLPYAYFEIAERQPGFDGFLAPQARQLFEMTAPPAATPSPTPAALTTTGGPWAVPRRHPRRPAVLHVELGYGSTRVPVSTENLSLGGLFLQVPDDAAPAPHTVLELGIDLPEGTVRTTGTVVYCIEGRGVGIEFIWWDDVEDPERRQLALFLDSLRRA